MTRVVQPDAMKRLRAGLLFRKCGMLVVVSSLESVLEQRDDLSTVQSQPVHAKYTATAYRCPPPIVSGLIIRKRCPPGL